MRLDTKFFHDVMKVDMYQLVKKYGDNFRIVICGDRATRCWDGKHTDDPAPFALFGNGIYVGNAVRFCEANFAAHDPVSSLTFLREVL